MWCSSSLAAKDDRPFVTCTPPLAKGLIDLVGHFNCFSYKTNGFCPLGWPFMMPWCPSLAINALSSTHQAAQRCMTNERVKGEEFQIWWELEENSSQIGEDEPKPNIPEPLSLPFCVNLVEQRKLVIQKDSLVPFKVWLLDGRLALENGIFR